jgi:hypothetical protein
MVRSRLFALILIVAAIAGVATVIKSSSRPTAVSSLRHKTDAELLEFVAGRRDSSSRYVSDENDDDRARSSPLDRLWEMEPKEAALVLVADFVNPRQRGTIVFEIDDPAAKPPPSGEIGLWWKGGVHYGPYEEGVTILKYEGYNSKLLISKVGVEGMPSREELDEAVMKTDEHHLYRSVAQQTFEILWWLRHIRFQNEPRSYSGATHSSADNLGRFWMKPDGPMLDEVIIGEPCGQCINANKDPDAYVGFADTLLRRVIQRSGIKDRYPIPKVGKWKPEDEDDDFLHTRRMPEPTDDNAVSEYVQRLCAILQNPDRTHLYDTVMERLVPISDPLRYKDKRIDESLLVTMRRGLAEKREPPPLPDIDYDLDKEERKRQLAARQGEIEKAQAEARKIRDNKSAGSEAAEKLGMHDATQAFDELLRLAKDKTISLMPAAKIAGRHPDLRRQMVDYVKTDLSLETIWRADIRELEGELENLAGSDSGYELFYKYTAEQEKAHHAAILLATWREPEKLTKTKLDIMLTGAIGRGADIPEVLRKEFSELSPADQLNVRNFVTWMRTVDVPWSRRYIENTFTPHTPRPDILFER